MAGRSVAPRVDPGVWNHPKTRAVARACGLPPERVVYHLTQMWAMVLRKKTGGLVFTGSNDPEMQRAIQRDFGQAVGTAQPARLMQALVAAGFVEQHGNQWWVHDWTEWQGGRDPRAHARYSSQSGDSNSGPEYSQLNQLSLSTGTAGQLTGSHSGSGVQVTGESGAGMEGAGRKGAARKTTGEGPHSSAPFTRFMWWLVEGFGHKSYQNDGYDPAYLTRYGKGVDMALVAECYIAIKQGDFGDSFDRRNLTARHAMKKIDPFAAFKARRNISGTIIPLTTIGAEHHPSTRGSGDEVAGADAGETIHGDGAPHSPAGSHGAPDLGYDEKLRAFRARQAEEQQERGLAF